MILEYIQIYTECVLNVFILYYFVSISTDKTKDSVTRSSSVFEQVYNLREEINAPGLFESAPVP
jgi:hypothetical protein